MNKLVWARNTVTGKITKVPSHYLTHPVIGKNFVPADKDDKDYLPEMYTPKLADEFIESKKSRKKSEPEEAVEVPEIDIADILGEVSDNG